jgi:ribokinase
MNTTTCTTARVCVVGNAAIDLTLRVERLPLAGETLLAVDTVSDFGGKGANQAVIATRAGASTQLFAALGCDADGDRILAKLIDEGIDTRHVVRLPCATDLSIVTVDDRGENTIVTRNDAAARYRPESRTLLDATRPGDWIVLQGNLSATVTADMLRGARLSRRRTLLNPGPVRFDCLPLLTDVDVLVVNRVEAAALSALDDPTRAAAALHHAGARDVFVTLGADGALWCDDAGTRHVAAMRTVAVDTVGAGDAFCGTLVAALGHNLAMPLALRWAQSAAALAVTRRGAQASFPDRAAMRDLLNSLASPPQAR